MLQDTWSVFNNVVLKRSSMSGCVSCVTCPLACRCVFVEEPVTCKTCLFGISSPPSHLQLDANSCHKACLFGSEQDFVPESSLR